MSYYTSERTTTYAPQRFKDFTITAKNPTDWTWDELDHFRVSFKLVDFHTFFRQEPDVLGPAWSDWLTAESDLDAVEDEQAWSVLEKVSELHDTSSYQVGSDRTKLMESLSNELFRLFGYIIPGKIRSRISHTTHFTMCGEKCAANIDNALLDMDTGYYALVGIQQVKPTRYRARSVAEALAAFVYNNSLRDKPLTEVLVPVVTLYHGGSTPTFYLVPITQSFADDVAAGRSPEEETVILTYEPIPEEKTITYNLGLAAITNRLLITQAYLAFKKFLLRPSGESLFPIDGDLHCLDGVEDRILIKL